MRKTLIAVLLVAAWSAHAQTVSIKRVELAGEKIIVHYDLEDSNPANQYQIQLYASQNNFATALTKVSGDVGDEVKPGSDKKIQWNIREELGPYKGRLSLEIRGRAFVPVARINSVSAGEKLKRGKSHTLTWKPGNNNNVTIQLLKGDQPVTTQNNQPNNGSYTFFLPTHTVVGKDYSIRITDSSDGRNSATSPTFSITRKVPLLLKVVPIIAVGGVAAFLAGSGGGGGGGDNGGDTPGAIELPIFPN